MTNPAKSSCLDFATPQMKKIYRITGIFASLLVYLLLYLIYPSLSSNLSSPLLFFSSLIMAVGIVYTSGSSLSKTSRNSLLSVYLIVTAFFLFIFWYLAYQTQSIFLALFSLLIIQQVSFIMLEISEGHFPTAAFLASIICLILTNQPNLIAFTPWIYILAHYGYRLLASRLPQRIVQLDYIIQRLSPILFFVAISYALNSWS